MKSKKDLNKRSLSYGLNSVFTILVVLALVGLINFLGYQYPQKADLTKNKLHTFSDQSTKLLKNLKDDIGATFYYQAPDSKERYRAVFDNYKKSSNKFKYEAVDINKEPTRTKTAGIKKADTLLLSYRGKTAKVETITEESITNSLIKLTTEAKSIVCTVVGHGEPSFTDGGATGFAAMKKGLEDESYELKEITLAQEVTIPADCTALVMMGANKAFFPAEIKTMVAYLELGGRLIVGVDATITQVDQTKELRALLHEWGIDVRPGIIIDPVSKMAGVDASIPIVVLYNKEQAITKEFSQQCYFPFARAIDAAPTAPDGLKASWLAKSTPKSWAEMNMASIAKGAVQFDQGDDLQGPLSLAVAVSGKRKDSKATRETRIVAFGTSQFANNQYYKFGGNQDLFLNSVSWAVENESMISIRAKEETAGQIEMSQTQAMLIFWLIVVLLPLSIAVAGIVIWVRRKKM